MVSQSESALENNLIKTLINNGYEYISIKNEKELETNFKNQLERFNKTIFTDEEFKKILICLD